MDRRAGILIVILFIILALALIISLCLARKPEPCAECNAIVKTVTIPPPPEVEDPLHCSVPAESGSFNSSESWFRLSSVASDDGRCSTIGTAFISQKRGSSVDAAIATLLCLGVINPQNSGLGGGNTFVIRENRNSDGKMVFATIVGRETAPLFAKADMYKDDPATQLTGPLSISVPGEVNGFREAWEQFGTADWESLFQPSILLCTIGWNVSEAMAASLQQHEAIIRGDKNLRAMYMSNGTLLKAGDWTKNPKLGDTLYAISKDPEAFYHSELTQDMVDDMKGAGGKLDISDFESNEAVETVTNVVSVANGTYKVHTALPPSSGVVVQLILNIMDGYDLESGSFYTTDEKVLLLHRLIEAQKFAIARTAPLGDSQFPSTELTKLLDDMRSADYVDEIRKLIDDNDVRKAAYYNPDKMEIRQSESDGATHVSVLAADGAVVSVTSSLGSVFGSKVLGSKTGIIFNSMMKWFTPAQRKDSFNHVEAKKRGQSPFAPIIVIDGEDEVVLVAGASGGIPTITSTSFVVIQHLYLGIDLVSAINEARVHQQLVPDNLYHDVMPEEILAGLKKKGHSNLTPSNHSYPYLGVVDAVGTTACDYCFVSWNSCINGVSDFRMGGAPDGF